MSGPAAVLAAASWCLVGSAGCDAPNHAVAAVATVAVENGDVVEAPEAEEAPDPNDVYIEEIATGGKGCLTPDSVSTLISDDRKSFIIIYDKMLLENPPGPAVKATNCQAAVKLHIPGGWQVSLATVNTRGYAFLEKGIKGRQTSSYIFAGVPLGAKFHTELKGPFDDFYDFTDVLALESVVWSPCGASAIFGINTSLNLNAVANPEGNAIFNTTDTDGKFQKTLHWQWQKC
ncbi:DUF4360 domain-containing protein [Amaricoccus sp.]|jgi:hypothetical protein|uniref:DUF4360 domain-containing protein n=1 Tax=Amaricoccus sp. TaxID=1872485 RepID=UPI001B4CED9E|nr:DUF4360 domain-containing protein [Amaricoccus sp.]MBP7243657.1 DUF4360 domain-containing protein [Amaricoccus sp.]